MLLFVQQMLSGTARVTGLMSSHEIRSYIGHAAAVYCCAFSPSGEKMVSASRDRTLKVAMQCILHPRARAYCTRASYRISLFVRVRACVCACVCVCACQWSCVRVQGCHIVQLVPIQGQHPDGNQSPPLS